MAVLYVQPYKNDEGKEKDYPPNNYFDYFFDTFAPFNKVTIS